MNDRVHGVLGGMIVAVCAFSFLVFVIASPHLVKASTQQQQLPSWSSSKIRAQMGEANQVVDGSAIGLPQGTTCRLWFQQARAIILCTA